MSVVDRNDCIRGVVGVIERSGRFLMIRRSNRVRAPGQWCFPGGAIEAGESPAEAIVREFQEEVGLIVEADRKLWSWCRPDGGLYLEWWLVRQVGGDLNVNQDEVQEARWMSDVEIRSDPDMIPNNVTFLDRYRANAV